MRRITLAPSHYAVVLSGLAAVLAATGILFERTWNQLYMKHVVIPLLEVRYGFQGGRVSFADPSTQFEQWGLVSFQPGSPLVTLGLRSGDVPVSYHDGLASMYHALRSAELEQFAAFEVTNVHEWKGGARTRTIVTHPRGTDLPAHFRQPDGQEQFSPGLRFGLIAVERRPDRRDLVMRDYATATSRAVYSYQTHVSAVWSTDEAWIAVTDYDDFRTSRCILVDTRTGARADVADLAARVPEFRRQLGPREQRACEVFGWVRGTGRVAIMLWNSERQLSPAVSYFLDTTTWRLSDARAH